MLFEKIRPDLIRLRCVYCKEPIKTQYLNLTVLPYLYLAHECTYPCETLLLPLSLTPWMEVKDAAQ